MLHDATLYYDCPITPSIATNDPALLGPLTKKRAIHISTLQIPVSYEAVLAIVPGIHQTPPALPNPEDPDLSLPDPPKQGFDLVLHVVRSARSFKTFTRADSCSRVSPEVGLYASRSRLIS